MFYENETSPVIEAFYYPCARGLQGGTDTLALVRLYDELLHVAES